MNSKNWYRIEFRDGSTGRWVTIESVTSFSDAESFIARRQPLTGLCYRIVTCAYQETISREYTP